MSRPPAATDRVAAEIEAGIPRTYPHGSWLPPTRALSTTHDASRMTVMRAIDLLAVRRIVDLYPGQGAKVAAKRYTVVTRTDYGVTEDDEEWRGFPPAVIRAGGVPFVDITGSAEVVAPPDAAERLRVPRAAIVFERVRVQGAVEDGRRVTIQLATSWYTRPLVEAVPEIRDALDVDPPPVRRRMLDAGRAIHYEHTAEARHANPGELALLELADPPVVFEVWRLCVDEGTEEPLEVTKMVIDAKRISLRY